MSSNIISKEELIEPFNIITEVAFKSITTFPAYYKSMLEEFQTLNQLDFDAEYKLILDYAKALSNDTRLKILYFINKVKKTCFCELERIFQIKQSTLNYHLGLLKRANMVQMSKEGKLIIIQLSQDFNQLLPKHFGLFTNIK